jgi:two-component system nitrate/nitrite response regulator NarL
MIIYLCASDQVEERWNSALDGMDNITRLNSLQDLNQCDLAGQHVVLIHTNSVMADSAADFKQLRQSVPKARFILCPDLPNDDEGIAFLREGAYGYCNAYVSIELLQKIIGIVRDGEVWVGWELMNRMLKDLEPARREEPNMQLASKLTDREQEITAMIADGESNKRIADRLNISERTVKNHLHSIFKKTGTKDRLNLALEYSGKSRAIH